jgi:hypothetical protein
MTTVTAALTSTWQSQRLWSEVASRAGSHIDRWRRRNLMLLGIGSLMGALAAQEHWIGAEIRSGCAIVGAAVLALAGVFQSAFLGPDQVRLRTVARMASEALKAQVYRYLTGVPPYGGEDADSILISAATRVDDEAADYLAAKASATADDKAPPKVANIDEYIRERAVQQHDWHISRVRSLESRARALHAAELIATSAAAVLAAVASLAGLTDLTEVASIGAWVGLATTVSSAIAAHLAAGRYERLAATYAHTATQLDRLIVDRESSKSIDRDAAFVDAVEAVLAAQNGGWVVLMKP